MANDGLIDRILATCEHAAEFYNRLLLLVGPTGSGKTATLQALGAKLGVSVTNLNLELSRRLLEVPLAQRSIEVSGLLAAIVKEVTGDPVVLDNTEIMFAPELQVDPLRALRQFSRDRTVIASWNGRVEAARLVYAAPGHPEYRSYAVKDLILILAEDGQPGPSPKGV